MQFQNLTKEIRMTFTQSISRFHREESGQDLVEYALVLVAVATGVVAGSATLAGDFATWMTSLKTKINALLT
jgi:Flp pilus assembly pilin Flp